MVIKTVLITGGLGCLGGGLAQHLLNAGYQVVVGSSRRNAQLPRELTGCSLVYTDFDNIDELARICHKVDGIVHLATVNAQQCNKDPVLATKVNGIGTYNLVQAALRSRVKYFLYFSTAHVYGKSLTGMVSEDSVSMPTHPYAITHRLAEDFLLSELDSQSIMGSVIRLSNSIGLPLVKEANCWMLFVNDVCLQAIVDRRIVINSNPNSQRDFIPMTAVFKTVESFLSNPKILEFPVFNVGSGVSYTLMQMASMIANRCERLFGYYPEISVNECDSIQLPGLEYKIDKLMSVMECEMDTNLELSIDEVLMFCNARFG